MWERKKRKKGTMSILSRLYEDWLQEVGVRWNKVTAAYVEEGWRGIVAVADIEAGKAE